MRKPRFKRMLVTVYAYAYMRVLKAASFVRTALCRARTPRNIKAGSICDADANPHCAPCRPCGEFANFA